MAVKVDPQKEIIFRLYVDIIYYKMKLPLFIIISLFLAICVNCTSYKYPKTELPMLQDSLYFNDCDIDYIGNYDSIYKSVESNIFNYARVNHIEIPNNKIDAYKTIERLVHEIYDYQEPIENEWQLYCKYSTTCSQLRFLNKYLIKQIYKTTDNILLTSQLDDESELIDSLESSQHRFLKLHFDYADEDTPHHRLKYYQASLSILNDRNDDLKDLFFSIVNATYHNPKTYLKLSNRLFTREYSHIHDFIIPQHKNDPHYNVPESQKAISAIKQAWFTFIAKREKILRVLPIEQQNIWINSTFRFKRSHLILLKNEFEGLGLLGPEIAKELILPDTCTYEELISYPDFSTMWKKYEKQFKQSEEADQSF